LALQQPRSPGPEHDEMLFIVIHQVYELWFKEMLHELGYLEQLLRDNDTPRALHTLKRILTVLKVMVAQIDVLETMTPLEFLSFRDRLESGSGFQSFQFRELEFVLGTKNPAAVARYPEGSEGRRRLAARYREPTLWDAFLAYLARNQYPVPASLLGRDVTRPPEPSREMQQVLITVYRTNPAVASVCERLVEGIAEQMRLQGVRKTRFAALSRAVCGVRGTSLILNLPGSPAGAVESLEAVMDLLPHALELIAGKTEHERR